MRQAIISSSAASSTKGALIPLGSFYGNGVATTASFQNIPQTYQDLMIHVHAQANNLNTTISARFNNDSGTNYSYYYLKANGVSANTGAFGSNFSDMNGSGIDYYIPKTNMGGYFYTATYHILNYANTSNWKQMFVEYAQEMNMVAASGQGTEFGFLTNSYRSLAGINRIDIYCRDNAAAFAPGTMITLYGIRAGGQ
jgi:hypothetical protein